MSTGIVVHHAPRAAASGRDVRLDHAGFVGVVAASRWAGEPEPGDFVEVDVEGADALAAHPLGSWLDETTARSVRAFFANGGRRARVFGVVVRSADDLVGREAAEVTLGPLLDRLRHDEDVSLLLAPALAWLPIRDGRPVGHDAVCLLLRHCREAGERFLLLDPPHGASEPDLVAWIARLRGEADVDPSYGALYFPWLHQGDVAVPPSGAVAGAHARLFDTGPVQGLRRAPANVDLVGFTHPAVELGWSAASALVDAGLDPIVVQASRGLVVAGARTLSSDPRWRSILARRIVSYVAARARRDADWAVFEPLRPELYRAVARALRARLDELWRAGLLTGPSAGAEYEVRCDTENNPPAVRDRGEVHVRIQLRPVSATEFVEIDLQLVG